MIWWKFAGVQLAMLLAAFLGLLILIPFCLLGAWTPTEFSDRWSWRPLNYVYGNPEDGVSGQHAQIWNRRGQHVGYMPRAWYWWRAYCWSALRNSCDNLKYVFADPNGPLKLFSVGRATIKAGWQLESGYRVPVLSISWR